MDLQLYNQITEFIKAYPGFPKNCLQALKANFINLSHDTLYSILFHEYAKKMRCSHSKSPATISRYWDLYNKAIKKKEKPGIILRISQQFHIAPCLVAKLILQKYLEEIGATEPVNYYIRDTALIPNMELAYEVFLCTLYDNMYSPLAEIMRNSLGQQYEIKLHNEVVKLELAFRDEEHLRKYGYDKTPDVKLDVPVAVDGFVINWIESKALFGDEDAHRDYVKNQYLSYWNRFGPGLVIYWFGFLKTLTETEDKRFIIRDHLPVNIVRINPECLSDQNSI